jgi:hypothetical protein
MEAKKAIIREWRDSPGDWYTVEAKQSNGGQISVMWKCICPPPPALPKEVLARIPDDYGRGWKF